jgi:predicted exporter
VVDSLCVGFVVTAAAGLLMVDAFNLISVAFGVLFIGLAADFCIQFAVRAIDRSVTSGTRFARPCGVPQRGPEGP